MSNSPYCINHEHKTVLIWSPKCACTSLQYAFIKNICKIDVKKDPMLIAKQLNYVNHDYDEIPENYNVYMAIRNPFDKIVSCYINKFI